jgi:hypothetical protein
LTFTEILLKELIPTNPILTTYPGVVAVSYKA